MTRQVVDLVVDLAGCFPLLKALCFRFSPAALLRYSFHEERVVRGLPPGRDAVRDIPV